jgi:hypothetical protein
MHPHRALTELLSGQPTRHDINEVVRTAVEHARVYVRWLVWTRGYTIAPLGMSMEDLAYDLIAELVSEIDGPQLRRLQVAVRDVLERDEGADLDAAFKAVCYRTVQVNLARLFIEIHPVRARLLRSLRRFEKAQDGIVRIESITGFWYAFADRNPRLERSSAPADLLWSFARSVGAHKHPVHTVLRQLLESLTAFPELRQAVSEEDVLDITLRIIQTDQVAATPSDSDPSEQAGIDAEKLTDALLLLVVEAREWVFSSYVRRDKLRENEAEAMLAAIHNYVTDLSEGNDHGHFYYLQQRIPTLTQETYRREFRNTYEYIVRSVFTRARERLQLFLEEKE